MALVPALQKFTTASQAIASYNYLDIEEGVGYVVYYLGKATAGNLMRNVAFFSEEIMSSKVGSNELVKQWDYDFDNTFNTAKSIKGTGLFTIPYALEESGSPGAYTVALYYIIKVRKWDGTSETEIANATSNTKSLTGGVGGVNMEEGYAAVEVTIPETHFAAGETLRITIEGWYSSGGNSMSAYMGHDPKNRTDELNWGSTFSNTSIEAHIPYKLDI